MFTRNLISTTRILSKNLARMTGTMQFLKAAYFYAFYGLANKSVNREGLQKLKENGHLRVNVSKKTGTCTNSSKF